MRSNLNFNHLECFFSLAKTLSFSKTSQELSIAQPAVSKQIKLLEEHYETQLFYRTKQSVQLTKEGGKIFDEIYPLFKEICARNDQLLEKEANLTGKITFGCFSEVGENLFINPLIEFKKQHPDVLVEMHLMGGVEIVEGVKSGAIDVGIVSTLIEQENIRAYEIMDGEVVLVTNPSNSKKEFSGVNELPFVTYREQDPLIEYYLQKVFPKTKRKSVRCEFSVNSHRAMVDVLLKRPFYGVLPTLSIEDELKKKKLINVGPKNLNSKLYLIYRDSEFPDRITKELSLYLRDYMKSL